MNKSILIGRLTRDPDVYEGENGPVVKYTLAVDRYKEGADFIRCVAFGKGGAFARDYLKKGTKIAVTGRIQTGSYTNKEGQTVNTCEVIVENHEFCESKKTETVETAVEQFQGITPEDNLPFN